VPQHMRMNRKWELSGLAGSLNHSEKPSWRYWSASFGHKGVWARSL